MILNAMEAIYYRSGFACHALEDQDPTLRTEFEELFQPSWFNPNDSWTFISLPNGLDEDPMPSREEQINIRLTALWFFYHMQ